MNTTPTESEVNLCRSGKVVGRQLVEIQMGIFGGAGGGVFCLGMLFGLVEAMQQAGQGKAIDAALETLLDGRRRGNVQKGASDVVET